MSLLNRNRDNVYSQVMNVLTESHLSLIAKSVEIGEPGFHMGGTYYAIRWVNGIPYRDRVETLVVKDGSQVFMRMTPNNPQFKYMLPGGGIDPDSLPIKQAENEVNEEAVMSIRGIYCTGISHLDVYQDTSNSKFSKIEGFPVSYRGEVSMLYVAEYEGRYDGEIEEKDLDPAMEKEGRFYNISDLLDVLRPHHLQGLYNSPLVNAETKTKILGCNFERELFRFNEDDYNEYRKIFSNSSQNTEKTLNLKSYMVNHSVKLTNSFDELVSRNRLNPLAYYHKLEINKYIGTIVQLKRSYGSDSSERVALDQFHAWIKNHQRKINSTLKGSRFCLVTESSKPLPTICIDPSKSTVSCFESLDHIPFGGFGTHYIYGAKDGSGNRDVSIMESSHPVLAELVGRVEFSPSINGSGMELTLLESTLKILLEADPLDDEDAPEEPTDYTSEEPGEETEPEEPTDYTSSARQGDDGGEPEEDAEEDGATEPTDYTEDNGEGQEGEDGEDPEEPTDYTSDTPDDGDAEGDDPDDVEATDYTDDVTDEGNDDGADEDTDGEETTDDTTEDETDKPQTEGGDTKNLTLMQDMVKLYKSVQGIIPKLEAKTYAEKLKNSCIAQVLKNLYKLSDFIHRYITQHYSKNNYQVNLYYYNLFIKSLQINVQMMGKIQQLDIKKQNR